MKNIKKLLKAFTLAEVLITLAIIGVVATLTLPALNQNIQQQNAEASLAKAINTLENANEQMKLDNNSKTISRAWGQNNLGINFYLQELPRYLNGNHRNMAYNVNGTVGNRDIFFSKDGIVYIGIAIPWMNPQGGRNFPRKYFGEISFPIVIDINGIKGPNRYGRDQFRVYLDNYGIVIPQGGAQFAEYVGGDIRWEADCPSDRTVVPNDPEACAGAIVDNGYKILYNFNGL